MAAQLDVSKLMSHHALFAGFQPEQMASLAQRVSILRLQPDEILFQHGETADYFYLVAHGQMKLYRVSPEGVEKVVNVMSAGRSFAEAVMFMKNPVYPVNAASLGETTLLRIPNDSYKRFLQQDVNNCFALIASLSSRLQFHTNELESLILTNATHRVIRYFVRQLPRNGENTASFVLELPKQVIASKLSVKPETFSRILSALTKSGIIRVENKIIHVLDVPALVEYES